MTRIWQAPRRQVRRRAAATVCAACATANDADARFCKHCGASSRENGMNLRLSASGSGPCDLVPCALCLRQGRWRRSTCPTRHSFTGRRFPLPNCPSAPSPSGSSARPSATTSPDRRCASRPVARSAQRRPTSRDEPSSQTCRPVQKRAPKPPSMASSLCRTPSRCPHREGCASFWLRDSRKRPRASKGGRHGSRRAAVRGIVVFGPNSRVLMEFQRRYAAGLLCARYRQQRTIARGHRRAADHRPAYWRRRRQRARGLVADSDGQRRSRDGDRSIRARQYAGAGRVSARPTTGANLDAAADVAGRARTGDRGVEKVGSVSMSSPQFSTVGEVQAKRDAVPAGAAVPRSRPAPR